MTESNIPKHVQTALVLSFLAAFGWLLQEQYSTHGTRFTNADAKAAFLTVHDSLADIDKRIALVELNVDWLRSDHMGYSAASLPLEAAPPAPMEDAAFPKYDVRQAPQAK